MHYKHPTKRIGLIQSKRHHLTCSGYGEKLPTFVYVVKQQSITHTLTLLLCNVRINTPLFDNYEIISHIYELYIISTDGKYLP